MSCTARLIYHFLHDQLLDVSWTYDTIMLRSFKGSLKLVFELLE